MRLIINIPDKVYSYVIDELSVAFKDNEDDSILYYLVRGIIDGNILSNEGGEEE